MKKKYWWIGTSVYNHLKELKVIPGEAVLKDMEDLIYFDNENDAMDFLKKMREFIVNNYQRAKDNGWYNN